MISFIYKIGIRSLKDIANAVQHLKLQTCTIVWFLDSFVTKHEQQLK